MPIFDPFSESAAIQSSLGLIMGDGGISLPGGGISYLLRDTFSTAIAAGSINGTTCDTGQARTVTDGNSKLSITGGVASITTGGAAAGDPGLWYPAQTRQNGLLLFANVVPSSVTFTVGWDTAQSGNIGFAFRINAGGLMGVHDNGGAILVEPAVSPGTTYIIAIGLRSAGGCWYWIKGGIYTNFELIWISPTSTANLFPGFANVSTTEVYTVDDMRIPQALYVPSPLAYDTFTR